MTSRLDAVVRKCACWLGLAFIAFSLSTGVRLGLAVALFAAGFLAVRHVGPGMLAAARRLASRNGAALLALVVVLAAAFRAAFFLWNYSGNMAAFQCADGVRFWQWAQETASGSLPEVKSWTTVAAYSVLIKLVGGSLCFAAVFNFIVQTATAWLLYLFGIRTFGRLSGVLSFAFYLLSPTFVLLTFSTLSEHFFFFFVAACLVALERWCAKRSVAWAVATAVYAWLATWSRGEGILLVVIAGLCTLCAWARTWRREPHGVVSLVVYMVAVCLLGVGGWTFNRLSFGVDTAFCSNDNWWPRLHGANIGTRGRVTNKRLIYEQYLVDHPGDPEGVMAKAKPNYCPPELVPYIKRETLRRWREMSTWTKVKFVVCKEHFEWAHAFAGDGRQPARGARALLYEFAPALVLLVAAYGLLRMSMSDDVPTWVGLSPLALIAGMVCVLVLYESNIRYGTMLQVLLPIYGKVPKHGAA